MSPLFILVPCVLVACGRIGIDRRDEHGMTALMRAGQRGDSAEAARLIDRGANVRAVVPSRDVRELIAFLSWMQQLPSSDIGYSALHYAAAGGHAGVARLLIARGADLRHAARGGETALDLAVSRSRLETIEVLVAAGAPIEARHLAAAIARSPVDVVRFLLASGADPDAVASASRPARVFPPPVIMASQRGEPPVLAALIEAGADVNARDRNGWSALRWARRSASREPGGPRAGEIIAMLEAAGAQDEDGARAESLLQAIFDRDVARVQAALRAGADPNSRDDRGVPPLVHAANVGSAEIVEALVIAGADVNANPEHDATPLIAAITGGSLDAVKVLLAAGARVDQADRIRRTPLEVASGWNRTEVTHLLLAHASSIDPDALPIAALNGNVEQVRILLARGADPNANRGHALNEAARGCYRRDNREVIRALIDAGADPKISDDHTALHRAAGLCDSEVVRLMLERGADPDARDVNGSTPLVSAAVSGRAEAVRLLIAAGADVNSRDDDGKSVLQHAARYPEIQAELRRAGAR